MYIAVVVVPRNKKNPEITRHKPQYYYANENLLTLDIGICSHLKLTAFPDIIQSVIP